MVLGRGDAGTPHADVWGLSWYNSLGWVPPLYLSQEKRPDGRFSLVMDVVQRPSGRLDLGQDHPPGLMVPPLVRYGVLRRDRSRGPADPPLVFLQQCRELLARDLITFTIPCYNLIARPLSRRPRGLSLLSPSGPYLFNYTYIIVNYNNNLDKIAPFPIEDLELCSKFNGSLSEL